MSDPRVDPLLEVGLLLWVKLTSAPGHDVAISRDGVSHVEVVDGISEKRFAQLRPATALMSQLFEAVWLKHIILD